MCKLSPYIIIQVDLKIMTKILATRLKSFLPQYIHPDQVGFVPYRQASNETWPIVAIISAVRFDWDSRGPCRGILLSLDLQKVFDTISCELSILRSTELRFWPSLAFVFKDVVR